MQRSKKDKKYSPDFVANSFCVRQKTYKMLRMLFEHYTQHSRFCFSASTQCVSISMACCIACCITLVCPTLITRFKMACFYFILIFKPFEYTCFRLCYLIHMFERFLLATLYLYEYIYLYLAKSLPLKNGCVPKNGFSATLSENYWFFEKTA